MSTEMNYTGCAAHDGTGIRPRPGPWHAGVPLHAATAPHLPAEFLCEALSGTCFVSVKLHHSLTLEPSEAPSLVVPALEPRSASTLTALHGLPLAALHDGTNAGLMAFTRLRVLTLCQTWGSPPILRAAQLPVSVEELTLSLCQEPDEGAYDTTLPCFAGFDSLCRLRRITLSHYRAWRLDSWDEHELQPRPVQLPPSLEVRTRRAGGIATIRFHAAGSCPTACPWCSQSKRKRARQTWPLYRSYCSFT